jgi:hypothetical protein
MNPAFSYTGDFKFTLNTAATNVNVQFGIKLPVGLEWCKFDLNLSGWGSPFFLGAINYTGLTMASMPLTLVAQVNVYNQASITAPNTAQSYTIKLGKTTTLKLDAMFEVVDPCLMNFKPG